MMVERVEELLNELEGMEKELMGMIKISDLAELGGEEIEMVQSYLKIYDLSKKLMREQANTIDNMNDKLDKIDEKLNVLLSK